MSKSKNPLALIENLSLKSLLTIMFFLLIGIVGLWRISQKPKQVSAEWFDESYSYRRSITLTNSGIGQTNVYITLSNLDTSDTSRFQADAGDIRFTDNSGSLLDYYLVSGVGTTNTIIHVNFDNLITGNSIIYLYYANPSAPNGFSASDFSTAASDLSVDSLASEETSPAPVAYWKFDEGVGTTAHDSSTNANHAAFGTGNSAPTWVSSDQCISGSCLNLDGTSDYLKINYSSSLLIQDQITLSAWINSLDSGTGSGNGRTIISNKDSIEQNFGLTQGYYTANKLGFLSYKNDNGYGSLYESSTDLPTNQWVHITATYTYGDYNSVKLYINGSEVSGSWIETEKQGTGPNSIQSDIKLGAEETDVGAPIRFFKGKIDDLKIYPYARTPAQILSDYNSGLAGQSSSDGSAVAIGGDNTGQSLSNGLVAYWKMDETSTPYIDSSGNGYTGTWVNNSYASGKFGIGTSLDGTGDYINFSPNFNFTSENFSVSYWLKLNSLTTDTINQGPVPFYKGAYTANGYYSQIGTSGYVRFYTNQSGAVQTSSTPDNTISVGTWYHLTYVRNGPSVRIYVNGEDKTSSAGNHINPASSSSNFQIGRYSTNNIDTNGTFDEFRLYNRALSPSEVKQLYQYAPGPIGYYKFDKDTGTTAVETDYSGNNYHLTARNFATRITALGKVGNALYFDGSNDRLEAANAQIFDIGDQSYTFTFWANATSGIRKPFSKGVNVLNGYSLYTNVSFNTNFSVEDTDGDTVGAGISTIPQFPNNWAYMTAIWNSDLKRVYFYLDGKLVGTSGIGTSLGSITTDQLFTIGSNSAGGYNWQGYIDDFKIYNYARTTSQIIQDMNGTGSAVNSAKLASPIAWYKFDESGGATANNSGNSKTTYNATMGTGSSAPTWSNTSKYGKSLYFDGNDYLTPNNSYLAQYSDHTYSAWFNLDVSEISSNSPHPIFGSSQATGVVEYLPASKLWRHYRQYSTGSQTVSWSTPYQYADGNWHHVVQTVDQTNFTVKLYLDGKYIGSNSITTEGYTHSNGAFVRIGKNYSNFWKGYLDDLKIYNYALTADEVKTDYNQGSSFVFGSTSQTIGATTTSLEYCLPGDTSYCAPPVGEWKFDEGVGTTAYDTSGNNYNGIFASGSASPSWTQGKFGKSLNFDGTDDYINTGNNVSLSVPYTIEGWVKIPTNPGSSFRYFTNFDVSGTGYPRFSPNFGSTNQPLLQLNGASYRYGTSNLADNKWHHITFIVTGSGINDIDNSKIYVDGKEETYGVTAKTDSPINPTGTLRIGGSFNFKGSIDQVRIYNYARTPAQIAYDYNRGAPIGWWKLDECQSTVAHDSSGNANHGVLSVGASGTQTTPGTCSTSGAWSNGSSGKLNSSLNFDGSDDYISVNDSNSLDITTEWSITSWIKRSGTTNGTFDDIVSKGTSSGSYTVYLDTSNRLSFVIQNVAVIGNSNYSTTDTNWHHVIVTRDSANQYRFYIDGIQRNMVTNANTPTINTNSLIIGGPNPFGGQIDDVRIYNYALTSTQVKTLYNGGAIKFSN